MLEMLSSHARTAWTRGFVTALVTGIAFALAVLARMGWPPPARPFAFLVGVGVLIMWPLSALGFYAASRYVGVDPAPLVAAATGRGRAPSRARLIPAVAVAGAVLTLLLSIPVIIAAAPLFEGANMEEHPLAGLDGPRILQANLLIVAEEVVFRLGIFFPLLAVFGVRGADRAARPSGRVIAAILASGVLFGLAHAPDAFTLGVDPFWYAVYAIVQKGFIGGGVFGYVAWRWGLEAAVLTHYTANLVAVGLGILVESGATTGIFI